MKRLLMILVFTVAASTLALGQPSSRKEEQVWKLEEAYWQYVKALDVEGYRTLWHKDFIGWPSSSSMPVRKDHITDWLSSYKEKGSTLRCYTLQRAGSQLLDNIVITHYLLTSHWVDKTGKGEPATIKVTHTWLKLGDDWKIIGGMAAPVDSNAHCD